MKSMHLADPGQTPLLLEKDVSQPVPAKGEVLVRVHAAGVTPTELIWYPTTHTRDGKVRHGAVPTHEFSGEIASVGDGVDGLQPGQEVYGMNDWFADGALAEYCLTQPDWIAPKPRHLTHVEAASVPIGALTAWQGLFNRAKLQAGERVLIHGGAGAVGIYAIQLARSAGAYVITTVSNRNINFVRELGADEALDYKASSFEEKVRDIDVVFDAVGGETLQRSWAVLGQNGRLVTIAADSEGTLDERTLKAFFIVEARHSELKEIGDRIDAGALRVVMDTVVPFAQAASAFDGTVQKQGRGKLVVAIG